MNNNGNVMHMQQEAAERVRRMQEHSRQLVREHTVNVYHGVTFDAPTETESDDVSREEKPPRNGTDSNLLSALLQGDQEQTLVLLLAVILAKNGAPLELVLALLYIAM